MECPECGKELLENSRFCLNCGYKLSKDEIDSVQKIQRKQKPINWKIIIICAIALIVVALIVIGIYIYSLPSTKYKRAERAFEAERYEQAIKLYEASGSYEDAEDKLIIATQAFHYQTGVQFMEDADYSSAILELEASDSYKDANDLIHQCHYQIGNEYFEDSDYINAATEYTLANGYENASNQILLMGRELTESQNYKDAITIFESAGVLSDYYLYSLGMVAYEANNYEEAALEFSKCKSILDAADLYNESQYQYAKDLLDSGKYSSAKTAFNLVSSYKDSSNLINCCSLMLAYDDIKAGNLNSAQDTLNDLPDDLAYGDISVASLSSLLSANGQWVALCGKWTCTSGQMRSTQSGRYRDTWWYNDFSDGQYNIEVRCILNDDNTVTVKTDGSIPIYKNYSSLSSLLETGIQSVSIHETVTSMGTVNINDYTAISFSTSSISVTYKKNDTSTDVYFTYIYKTNITYGKKTCSY